MQSQSSKGLRFLLAGALLLTPSLATAQKRDDAASDGKKRAAAASSQQANRGGMGEGIKVHGRWVIEVRNPDGSLVIRREFQNALATGGRQVLSTLLSRNGVPGRWTVLLGDVSNQASPCQGGAGANDCRIIESVATNPRGGNTESTDLKASLGAGNTVILAGTITALVNGVVNRVSTGFATCLPSTLVANCNVAGAGNLFSDAVLTPVPVVAGQIIQVTVTFSFS